MSREDGLLRKKSIFAPVKRFPVNTGNAVTGSAGAHIRRAAACITAILLCAAAGCHAQSRKDGRLTPQQHRENLMEYTVEGQDTVFIGELPAAKVYS